MSGAFSHIDEIDTAFDKYVDALKALSHASPNELPQRAHNANVSWDKYKALAGVVDDFETADAWYRWRQRHGRQYP